MSSFFGDVIGINEDVWVQTLLLSALCCVLPLVQFVVIAYVKMRHPSIQGEENERTNHTVDYMKREYKKLVKRVLGTKNKHLHSSIKKWLHIQKVVATNFSSEERQKLRKLNQKESAVDEETLVDKETLLAERKVIEIDFDSTAWMEEAIDEMKGNESASIPLTPMMKIINYHVGIIWWTGRLEQLNFGMTLSKETELRNNRLSWRGVVQVLRTIDDTPKLPKSINYSVVRELKDSKDWDYAKMGTMLTPQNLSIKPWPQIQNQAYSYLNSFLFDVTMHWFQIWYTLVFIKILLS